jgi:GNAT superfamily N-acetyltransferase
VAKRFELQLEDLAPGERTPRVEAVLERLRLEDVSDPSSFDEGYRLLDSQFGAANELERREVLQRWFELGSLSHKDAPVRAFYHMLLVREPDGTIVAARDAFSAVDLAQGRVVALMSHSLVLPAWRRTGLAAVLRAAPVVWAKQDAASLGVVDPEILLVAEMELVEPEVPESRVRLAAYRQGGFFVVPPPAMPYCQPDFRDVAALGIEPLPLPFLLLVRQVGEEHLTSITAERAIALLDGLDAIHGPSTSFEQLATIRAHTLRDVRPGGPALPLWELPASPQDSERLVPLLRSRLLPLWPEIWWGRPPGDPVRDEQLLQERP